MMMNKQKEARPQSPMMLLKMLQSVAVTSTSRAFDWTLFEPLPGENVSESENGLPQTVALAGMGQKSNSAGTGRIGKWIFGLVATGLLSLLGWWGGNKLAHEYSGMKNQKNVVAVTPETTTEKIPEAESVEDQYLSALWASRDAKDFEHREMHWQSVIDYFPAEAANEQVRNHTRHYNLLALSRLGELYLEQKELGKAIKVYDELANQEELLLNFRITGNAGKAIALDMLPSDRFEGGIGEQESSIRVCLNQNGVRENVHKLNEFLREKVEILLIRYPTYGKYLPKRVLDFAMRW